MKEKTINKPQTDHLTALETNKPFLIFFFFFLFGKTN